MAGINTLSFKSQITTNWNASAPPPNGATATQPTTQASTIQKSLSIATTAADSAAGGGDQLYSSVTNLAANTSVSIDVSNLTNIMSTAASAFVRMKYIQVQLLSTTDDSVYGTNCSSITLDGSVASAILSSSGTGWLATNTSKFDIPNGGFVAFGTPAAAGINTSSAKILKLTNNDLSNAAGILVTFCGGAA